MVHGFISGKSKSLTIKSNEEHIVFSLLQHSKHNYVLTVIVLIIS